MRDLQDGSIEGTCWHPSPNKVVADLEVHGVAAHARDTLAAQQIHDLSAGT